MSAVAREKPRESRDAALASVARFADSIRRISWFAALGEALLESERAAVARYLAALGRGEARIEPVGDWAEAERVARDPRWDRGWWEAEEAMRRRLLARASEGRAMDGVILALTRVTDIAGETVSGCAATAALRRGEARQGLAAAAAGAATQACYQAALALLAEAGESHPFVLKLRLYEGGRWPLGIVDGAFHLF